MIVHSVTVNGYSISAFSNKMHLVKYLNSINYNGILIAMNAEKILKDDSKLRDLVNSNLGYTDGIGAVWALKKKGIDSRKIAGAELWLEIIKQNYQSKSFFLIGAKPEVIQLTVNKLNSEFPGIQIVGYRDGYFERGDQEQIVNDLTVLKPDVVFVAMGSPKQEYFMEELLKEHPALYMGLGGSFDVYTGVAKRVSPIWNSLNLEWAYRLVKQPKRIFRQIHLLRFVYNLLLKKY